MEVADAEPLMVRTRDGKMALFAYSALDRLHEGCGQGHPWLLVPVEGLDPLQRSQGFDLILLDIFIPTEHRFAFGGSNDQRI